MTPFLNVTIVMLVYLSWLLRIFFNSIYFFNSESIIIYSSNKKEHLCSVPGIMLEAGAQC